MRDTHLSRILQERGLSLSAFARLVGVDKATVSRWSGSRIPAERVLEIEAATSVPRGELRPDLYPRTQHTSASAPPSACDDAGRTNVAAS